MNPTNRRRFAKYALGTTIVAALGAVSAYLLTPRTEQSSGNDTLPPGQSEVGGLQVLHVGGVPEIDLNVWIFQVYGEVEKPFELNWSQFTGLPRTTSVSDFHCVTGWTKLDSTWEGVSFKEIERLARPTTEAKYARIECYGDAAYTTSLPLEDLVREDVLLAYGLDGKQLAPEHGGPLRLVVPHKYGYKSAKWVKAIKFTEKVELGFWERRGYSNTADPWTNDRFG